MLFSMAFPDIAKMATCVIFGLISAYCTLRILVDLRPVSVVLSGMFAFLCYWVGTSDILNTIDAEKYYNGHLINAVVLSILFSVFQKMLEYKWWLMSSYLSSCICCYLVLLIGLWGG